jgi:hypothetical protein
VERGNTWMNVQMTSESFPFSLHATNVSVAADFRNVITSGGAVRYASTTDQAAFLASVSIRFLDAPMAQVLADGYNAGNYLTC